MVTFPSAEYGCRRIALLLAGGEQEVDPDAQRRQQFHAQVHAQSVVDGIVIEPVAANPRLFTRHENRVDMGHHENRAISVDETGTPARLAEIPATSKAIFAPPATTAIQPHEHSWVLGSHSRDAFKSCGGESRQYPARHHGCPRSTNPRTSTATVRRLHRRHYSRDLLARLAVYFCRARSQAAWPNSPAPASPQGSNPAARGKSSRRLDWQVR